MSYLKNLKKSKRSLVEQAKDAMNTGYEKDTRMLNFYDLKFGEQMKVVLVPDVNGELFCRFSKHGANLTYTDAEGKRKNVRGVGTIGTIKDSSKSPIMQHGYSLLHKAEETGNKAFKDEAKKFFPTNYAYVSVVVLESPIEIQQSEDGNDLKLFSVPYSIEKMILNVITSGEMEEDDLWTTPLIIKKTKNDGGWASYEDSMFSRKPMSDDMLDYLEELNVVQYDYETIDIIPETPTVEEQQDWLDKAIPALKKHMSGTADDSDDEEPARKTRKFVDDEEDETPRKTRRTIVEDDEDEVPVRKQRKFEDEEDDEPVAKKSRVVEESDEDELPSWADGEDAPEEKPSVQDRMARLRNRR